MLTTPDWRASNSSKPPVDTGVSMRGEVCRPGPIGEIQRGDQQGWDMAAIVAVMSQPWRS
jgi:hypothetical protein